jgi:peptidoglycan-N-acetylglucosamine deacetylase
VRVALSGIARAWPVRAVTRARAACVLSTLAVLSPIAFTASPQQNGRASGTAEAAQGARQRLFRPVGCRSAGGPYRHGPRRREVAIGFDDGPSRETGAFVRMLERSHARATFFVVGRYVTASHRAEMLRELRDGDAIGDHTFSHVDLPLSPHPRAQLQWALGAVRAQTGYTPCVFRPPYGGYDDRVIAIARSLGLAATLWNVDPSDYRRPGVRTLVRRVLSAVRPGSIIVSHDGGGPRRETLRAYPRIIRALHRRGYRLVTVPTLLGFAPEFAPCSAPCDGIGLPRGALPAHAIIIAEGRLRAGSAARRAHSSHTRRAARLRRRAHRPHG